MVISGRRSRVTGLISHIRGLITPTITTHEPPSMGVSGLGLRLKAEACQSNPARSATVVVPGARKWPQRIPGTIIRRIQDNT